MADERERQVAIDAAWLDWFAGYGGSIDVLACRLAHEAGYNRALAAAREENGRLALMSSATSEKATVAPAKNACAVVLATFHVRPLRPYAKLVRYRDDRGDRMWLWRGCAVIVGRGRWICRHLHPSASEALDCAAGRLARVAEGC